MAAHNIVSSTLRSPLSQGRDAGHSRPTKARLIDRIFGRANPPKQSHYEQTIEHIRDGRESLTAGFDKLWNDRAQIPKSEVVNLTYQYKALDAEATNMETQLLQTSSKPCKQHQDLVESAQAFEDKAQRFAATVKRSSEHSRAMEMLRPQGNGRGAPKLEKLNENPVDHSSAPSVELLTEIPRKTIRIEATDVTHQSTLEFESDLGIVVEDDTVTPV